MYRTQKTQKYVHSEFLIAAVVATKFDGTIALLISLDIIGHILSLFLISVVC